MLKSKKFWRDGENGIDKEYGEKLNHTNLVIKHIRAKRNQAGEFGWFTFVEVNSLEDIISLIFELQYCIVIDTFTEFMKTAFHMYDLSSDIVRRVSAILWIDDEEEGY
jgi:hypothetical protein